MTNRTCKHCGETEAMHCEHCGCRPEQECPYWCESDEGE